MDKIPSTKRKHVCLNFYLHGPNSGHISVLLLLLCNFVLCGFQLLVWPTLILLTVLFCFHAELMLLKVLAVIANYEIPANIEK